MTTPYDQTDPGVQPEHPAPPPAATPTVFARLRSAGATLWVQVLGIRDWRINTKLIATILLLAVIPVLIVSWSVQASLGGSLTAAQERALADDSANLANQLSGTAGANLTLAQYVARSNAIVRYAAAASADRVRYQDLAGTQLESLAQQDPTFEVAVVLDLDGNVLLEGRAANQPSVQKLQFGARDYFQQAKANHPTMSDVQVNAATQQPALYFAAPITGDNGAVVGVLMLRTNMKPYQELLAAHTNGAAMILDNDGVIVLHSSANDRYQYRAVAPLSAVQQAALDKNRPFGDHQVTVLGAKGFEKAFKQGPAVRSFSYTLGGEQTYGSMSAVLDAPWRVVVTSPAAAFTGPVSAQTSRNLLLGLVVLAAAAGLGFLT
ncbi:MAG: cache domain-containing protein, partial [Thermomicrobiales bacterium]